MGEHDNLFILFYFIFLRSVAVKVISNNYEISIGRCCKSYMSDSKFAEKQVQESPGQR